MKTGIEYQMTGDRERARVVGYHSAPRPRALHVGAKNLDIAHLPKRKQTQLLTTAIGEDSEECITSNFTIGFEIEKSELHSSAIKEHVLFTGMETDSSCGYEAITNVLPLLPPCKWRNKIFNMMHEARMLIDDEFSPSTQNCGGHITLGVKGYNGTEIAQKISKYMPIVLALYRKRLRNGYCGSNPFLGNAFNNTENGIGASGDRYSVCLIKGQVIELRIPNRVTSVTQLRLRYELMYALLDTAFNKPTMSLNKFIEMVKPIISKMYGEEASKVNLVCALALDFDKCVKTNKLSTMALTYVNLEKLANPVRHDRFSSMRMRTVNDYRKVLKEILTPKAYREAVSTFRMFGLVNSDSEMKMRDITNNVGHGWYAVQMILQAKSVTFFRELQVEAGRELQEHVSDFIRRTV